MPKFLAGCLLYLLAAAGAFGQAPVQTSASAQAPAQTQVPTTQALTLEDCVKRALAESPDLAIAQERLSEAQAQMRKGYAPFSPQASLNLNQIQLGYDELGNLNRGNRWDPTTYNGGIALNWNLFNGGKDFDKFKSAKYDAEVNVQNLAAARQSIIVATIQAYYGVLTADRSIEAQKEDLKSKTEHLETTQSMYKQGVRSYSDVLNAQIQAKQSEIDLINQESNKSAALYALNILLALPVSSPTAIADESNFKPVTESLDGDIQFGLNQRPEMLAARAELKSAQSQESFAFHDILPTLSINGLYNDTFAGVPYGTAGNVYYARNPFWQVNLGLSFPIWDGGVRYQEIKRAGSAVRLAQDTVDQTARTVQKDVADAFVEVQRNQQIYQAASSQVDAAAEDVKIIMERYRNGGVSVLDVVDAQANLLRTRLEAISALYNFHIAVFRLKQAMGTAIL